jgi:hypothetical protein
LALRFGRALAGPWLLHANTLACGVVENR